MSATARVVEFKIQFGQSRQGIPSLLNVIATTTPMVQTICHGTCDIDKYNIFTETFTGLEAAAASDSESGLIAKFAVCQC